MLYDLSHPGIMPATLPGFIGLWQAGVDAASVNMTYATYAVDAGMPLDDFKKVGMAQRDFLDHVLMEHDAYKEGMTEKDAAYELYRKVFCHDVLLPSFLSLRSSIEQVDLYPERMESWFRRSRKGFRFSPLLRDFVWKLIYMRMASASKKNIRVLNGTQDLKFETQTVQKGAQAVFGNLIDNMFKYNRPGGGFWVDSLPHGKSSEIIFKDYGIGMSPEFAARLGHGESIREERAIGVEGSGIGWTSIGRTARELGWTWEIETAPGKGTEVTLHLKDGDLVPIDGSKPNDDLRLASDNLISASDLIQGAGILAGAKPFAGYKFTSGPDGDVVDVSQSPLYHAIVRARTVLAALEKSKIDRKP
jgi:hypothetical protein